MTIWCEVELVKSENYLQLGRGWDSGEKDRMKMLLYKRVSHSSHQLFTAAVLSWFYLPHSIRQQFLATPKSRVEWAE